MASGSKFWCTDARHEHAPGPAHIYMVMSKVPCSTISRCTCVYIRCVYVASTIGPESCIVHFTDTGTWLFLVNSRKGRSLSWFWFAVGSWRRCRGGGDGDQKVVCPCRGRCARPGLFWAARGWSRAGAREWRSAGVHSRAETLAVPMANVACQTGSLA